MPRKLSREAFIASVLQRMSLDDKIGQCLTFEFHGTVPTPVMRDKILKLRAGGFRATPHVHEALPYHLRKGREGDVQRRAPWAGPAEYAQVINQLQDWAMSRKPYIPLHISVDCEGDFSNDIGKGGVNLLPAQMGLAATGDAKLAFQAWRMLARQLRTCGVNMLHSPMVDISYLPNNPTMGVRPFGDTPQAVARWGAVFMKALRSEGIISAAKHFPGLGRTVIDTHLAIDVNEQDLATLMANELFPYRALIAQGLPAIMVAHTMYRATDPKGVPATASRNVTDLLRRGLGFRGVTVTDSISMKGLLDYFDGDMPKTARATLAAGNDMILIKTTEDVEAACYEEVKKGVREGEITEEALDEHVRRIVGAKYDHGLFDRYPVEPRRAAMVALAPAHKALALKVAARCCTLLRNDGGLLPLKKSQRVLVVEPYFPLYQDRGNDFYWHSSMLCEYIGRYTDLVANSEVINGGTEEDAVRIVARSRDFDVCVVVSARTGNNATSTPIAQKLVDAGRKVVVVATHPYEYAIPAGARCVLVTYGMVPPILRNVADVLYGKSKPRGKWPLKNYKSPHARVSRK